MTAIARLRAAGLKLTARGETLLVEPKAAITDELRTLIRENKPAILEALAAESKAAPGEVLCRECSRFGARHGAQPDGWCRRYREETWAAVAFTCPGHEPSDPATRARQARRARVESDLRSQPEHRYAFDVADMPLKPATGEPVRIVLAGLQPK